MTFTTAVKEALAYPIRSAMEDRRVRIPHDPKVRADLRQVTKQVTAAGNLRFTAERTPDGHSDRFWALGLAIHAASGPVVEIDYQSTGRRASIAADDGYQRGASITESGFGTVSGGQDFGGF